MAELTGDKTHDPTPHRRQQAREAGHLPRSEDLVATIVLCGTVVMLLWLGRGVVDFLGGLTVQQLGGDAWLIADAASLAHVLTGLSWSLAAVLLPILGVTMLLAVAGNVLQVGLLFLAGRPLPDLSRIDPMQGLARLWSWKSVSRLTFGLFKLAVVAAVAWYSFQADRDRILNCGQLPLAELAQFIAETITGTALRVGLALLVLAALDYGFERLRYERDLRMTAQELREEQRNLQADPQTLSRRRALRRQSAQSRPAPDVAKADMVITSPQGLAVAVRCDGRSAPVVVAKGAGVAARQICAAAGERGVPVLEQPVLAQSLYETTKVNRAIPPRLYAGVAQLLTKVSLGGERRTPPPAPVA
jgi:flagellar biosynthesis protein FlhB